MPARKRRDAIRRKLEMAQHQIVDREEWFAARKALLAKEKEFTRTRDRLGAERRALPWIKIEKPYEFEGPGGKETLADLFGGKSQLIVKHFMLGPGWSEGCVGCSFEMDHVDGILAHLGARDISYVAVSRAPWPEIQAFRKRMGWQIKWVSSYGNDFNYDFHVSFTPDERPRGGGGGGSTPSASALRSGYATNSAASRSLVAALRRVRGAAAGRWSVSVTVMDFPSQAPHPPRCPRHPLPQAGRGICSGAVGTPSPRLRGEGRGEGQVPTPAREPCRRRRSARFSRDAACRAPR